MKRGQTKNKYKQNKTGKNTGILDWVYIQHTLLCLECSSSTNWWSYSSHFHLFELCLTKAHKTKK